MRQTGIAVVIVLGMLLSGCCMMQRCPCRCQDGGKKPAQAATKHLEISALVDSDSELHITPTGIYWKHNDDFAKPGRHEGRNEPTIVNGKPWQPVWQKPSDERGRDTSDVYPLKTGRVTAAKVELLGVGETMDTSEHGDRDSVTINTRVEDGEAVIQIADFAAGPAWYRFRVGLQ